MLGGTGPLPSARGAWIFLPLSQNGLALGRAAPTVAPSTGSMGKSPLSPIRSIVSSWKSSIQLGGKLSAAGWGGGGTRGAGQAAERGSWRRGRALPGDSHPPVPAGWGQREGLGVTGQPCTPVCAWVACPSEPGWAGGKKLPFPCCWTPCCSWGNGDSSQMAPQSRVPCWATQLSLQTLLLPASSRDRTHCWGHAARCHWGFVPRRGLPAPLVAVPSATSLVTCATARSDPAPEAPQPCQQCWQPQLCAARVNRASPPGTSCPWPHPCVHTHLPCQPGGAGPAGSPGGTAPAWARGA